MSEHGKDFSFDRISKFDEHIKQSISGFPILHDLIVNMASFFLRTQSTVVDLGCSTGLLLKKLKHRYPGVSLIGFDISESIIDRSSSDGIDFRVADITETSIPPADLVLSIFTIQFIAQEKRGALLRKIYDALRPGGAFIISEKAYPSDSRVFEVFEFSNYDYKRAFFTSDEILDKQKVLRQIMKPSHDVNNVKTLKKAGFSTVEKFFQSLNFVGYICIK